MKNDSAEDLTF